MVHSSATQSSNQSSGMYKWVVLAASFFTMFTTGSSSYASGVFHVALQEAFPEGSVTLLVWAGSLFLSMYGPGGVVGSVLINEFSCRTCVFMSGILGLAGFALNFFIQDHTSWLIFTYGILAGTSIGLAATGAIVVLGFYFNENVNIITSIALCGQGLGMFGHPPLVQYLIDTYGIRGAFLIYGGIAANACVLAMFMRPNQLEKSTQRIISSGRSRRNFVWKIIFGQCSNYGQLLSNGSFVFLFLGKIAFGMAIGITYLYLPEFFQLHGHSKQGSSFALAMSGIGSTLSRFCTGILSMDEKAGTGLLFTSLPGIIGIITLFILSFAGSPIGMLIYGLWLGLYTGGIWALISPLSLEILGLELSASGIGFLYLGSGLGYLSGPPLSNLVFDVTGNYQHVFIFAAFAFMTCSVCGIISTLARHRPVNDVLTLETKQFIPSENQNINKIDLLAAATEEMFIFVPPQETTLENET